MPYPHSLLPFSFKTNRYEVYALGEAVAGWKSHVKIDTDNQLLEFEKSYFRLYNLSELARKVIARKLVDYNDTDKDFRVQLSGAQLLTIWVCYQIYGGPSGQNLSRLRSIMGKIDKEMVNRLNARQLNYLLDEA